MDENAAIQGRQFGVSPYVTAPAALNLARSAGMVSTPRVESDSQQRLREMSAVADRLLRETARLLAAKEVGLLVYVIPDPLRVHDLLDMERYREDPTAPVPVFRQDKAYLEAQLLRTLEDGRISYLYPRDQFMAHVASGQAIYRQGFGHFTRLGHELSARLLADRLWGAVALRKSPGTSSESAP